MNRRLSSRGGEALRSSINIQRDSTERFSILGVSVCDTTMSLALDLIEDRIRTFAGVTTTVYFVNTHTLNVASRDADFAAVLCRAK